MMSNVKMNYMSDLKNNASMYLSSSCQTNIDSQAHFLRCQELRAGKDLANNKKLAKYLHDVLKIRNNLNIDK